MNVEQAARLAEVLKKIKAQEKADDEVKDFEGLKLVDLFNAVTSGAVVKLDVMKELFSTASGLPDDAPEDFIKYEAARLEAIMRKQINGLCDCLLAVIACENPQIEEAC